MTHASDPTRFDALSIALHWLTAIAVVAAFALGPGDFGRFVARAGDPGTRTDIVAHEALGLLVGLMTLVRLAWLPLRPKAPAETGPAAMRRMAVVVRVSLWVLLAATPLLGLVALAQAGQPVTLPAGLRLAPWSPLLPGGLPDTPDWGHVHAFLGDAIVWLAGLHAAGALVHRYLLHDGVLERMLPRR